MLSREERARAGGRAIRIALWTLLLGGSLAGALLATRHLPATRSLWAPLVPVSDGPSIPEAMDAGRPEVDAPMTDANAAVPHRQTAPLSSAQLGAPLVHGRFVTACGAPDSMKVVVKVKVRLGRAEDVDVKTTPPDPRIASCIAGAARSLRWDLSPIPGHVTVHY